MKVIVGRRSLRDNSKKTALGNAIQKTGLFLNLDYVEDEDVSEVVYFFQRETHDFTDVSNERILPQRLKSAYFLVAEQDKSKAKWDRVYICKSGNVYLVGCDYLP